MDLLKASRRQFLTLSVDLCFHCYFFYCSSIKNPLQPDPFNFCPLFDFRSDDAIFKKKLLLPM